MAKGNPKVDHSATDAMNLKVLKRDDQNIQEIVCSASAITMYELDMQTTKWHRKNVEGALFVVQRKSEPRFQFVVLNRLSDERFVETIADDAEFEMSEKYLLYKTDNDEVNGVWFYDENDQQNVFDVIKKAQTGKIPRVGGQNASAAEGSSSIDDVASLFQSAMLSSPGGARQTITPTNTTTKNTTTTTKNKEKKKGAAATSENTTTTISRDAIRNAMLRLATNDAFLDSIAHELSS
jgi:hypothetical protein